MVISDTKICRMMVIQEMERQGLDVQNTTMRDIIRLAKIWQRALFRTVSEERERLDTMKDESDGPEYDKELR